jgi:hypothetical protein
MSAPPLFTFVPFGFRPDSGRDQCLTVPPRETVKSPEGRHSTPASSSGPSIAFAYVASKNMGLRLDAKLIEGKDVQLRAGEQLPHYAKEPGGHALGSSEECLASNREVEKHDESKIGRCSPAFGARAR